MQKYLPDVNASFSFAGTLWILPDL